MQARTRTLLAIARAGLLAGGLLHLAVVVGLAAVRIPYAYELEWMEGGQVDAVRRVLAGLTIYPEPSLEFVPFLYTPLYFWVTAPVAALLGPGYLPLRLVAFAASLACMAILFALARRETGSALAGAMAAMLFAATYELSGAWFDVSRADTLFLALLLLAAWVLRTRGRSAAGLAAAGAVLFLSLLAKQTALFVAVPLAAWALVTRGRRGLWFAGTFGALAVASTAILHVVTDGWYLYYVIETPGKHEVWERYARGFWTNDLARPLWPALLVGLGVLAGSGTRWIRIAARDAVLPLAAGALTFGALRAATPLSLEEAGAAGVALLFGVLVARRPRSVGLDEREKALLLHVALFLGLLLAGWYVRRRTGSFANIVMPTHAGVALLFGIGFGRLAERLGAGGAGRGGEGAPRGAGPEREGASRPGRASTAGALALVALAAWQLARLAYDPRDHVPSESRHAAYAAFVDRLAEVEGDVLVPEHPWLVTFAGKESRAHRLAMEDCFTERVERELHEGLRERRFAAVVLDRRWSRIADELAAHYVERGPFVDAPLRPMTGLLSRKPPTLWTPRGEEGP